MPKSIVMRVLLAWCFSVGLSALLFGQDNPSPQNKGPRVAVPEKVDGLAWAKDLPEATKELLETFMRDQSAEGFLKLRQAVADSAAYDPYSDNDEAAELLEAKKFAEAETKLVSMAANQFLNPRYHRLLYRAAKGLGKDEAATLEVKFSVLCLKGILSTGDGRSEHPYLVLRVDDEYEVLSVLELRPASQGLEHRGDKYYDRIVVDNGGVLWFDVTTPHERLRKQLTPGK